MLIKSQRERRSRISRLQDVIPYKHQGRNKLTHLKMDCGKGLEYINNSLTMWHLCFLYQTILAESLME